MSIEDNKRIVRAYLEGNAVGRGDLVHPDLRFFVAGNMEGCGWLDAQGLFELYERLTRDAAGPLVIRATHMIAEGDFVSVEAVGHMPLRNGKVYNNHYHLLFELDGGRIRQVREYSDTDHLRRTFGLTGEPRRPAEAG